MKTYHTHRNTVPYQTMEYQNELRKNPHIEVLHSDPPQLRVNGKIIPWPQGKTPEEAYQDYLERESKPVPLNQLSEEDPSPAEEQHFVRQQEHSLHPLRQQYLQDRLKQLDYLGRQQALQDDFTTRMYGKKDYSKEQKKNSAGIAARFYSPKAPSRKKVLLARFTRWQAFSTTRHPIPRETVLGYCGRTDWPGKLPQHPYRRQSRNQPV